MIQLYNTLTRKKEDFIPIDEGKVKMYVCGPTVYNYIHIGNARSAVAFDTIRKYLEFRGYEVNYVSNFTDVDDKIIKAAKEMGKTPLEVANQFIDAFNEDTSALNISPATKNPRVMDHIPDIIDFIRELIEKDYAYVSDGDVYFRTTQFKEYGQLSHQDVTELEVGASQRVGDERERKQDALDFALWKSAKSGEIFWEAPWGNGRPGWHIECSVMTTKHLGETIDIHGGGHDLIFPHHENEIAQSEARSGKVFANYWLHNGFVTVGEDDEKMSKSLGNFVTVHELIQEVDPQVLRFFLSTTQYRRPIQFSSTTMKEAEVNLQRIRTAYQNLNFRLSGSEDFLEEDKEKKAELDRYVEQFKIEMDDDINTANGITVIYELIKWLNIYLEEEKLSSEVLSEAKETLETLTRIFGVELVVDELLDSEIEELIEKRQAARLAKDFATSDAIRDTLKDKGIILEDTAQGMRWRREE